MKELFAQLILARNDDVESWMNILFVVIIAVFWALGGILKARAKNVKEETKEPPSDKATRSRSPRSTGLGKELFKQPGRSKTVSPGLSRQYRRQIEQLRRRVSPRLISLSMGTEKKPAVFPLEKTTVKPRMSKPMPEIQMPAEERLELASEPVIESKDKYKYTAAQQEMPGVPFALESLLDYTNSDELKKAILHYEILGKPLSLRRPGEHISGYGS
jgi:hypothetical protein